MCKVSFVVSVYNCEKYIAETINSVINQTFSDWELILIDDCSRDRSVEIIKSFNNPKIRLIENKTNKGQCENLNYGISLAKGEYIARLDHDDICYPTRIEEQLNYMNEHPECVLCGSQMDIWENDMISRVPSVDIFSPLEVRFTLWFGVWCTPHSSFFIRKKAMLDNNIKYGNYLFAEDYDLLIKLLQIGEIGYVRKPLIVYRVFPEQCTQIYSRELKMRECDEIRYRYLDSLEQIETQWMKKAISGKLKTFSDYVEFKREYEAYAKHCGLDIELFKKNCMKEVFKVVCAKQAYGIPLLFSYMVAPYRDDKWLFSWKGLEFAIKCIIGYRVKEAK